MARFYTLILLLLLAGNCKLFATHIVGGEFELVHLEGYNYQVRLNQYFDHIHGNPGAEDEYLVAYIYSKKSNNYLEYVVMYNTGSEFVPYTNPDCRKPGIDLRTRKITYSRDIYLSPYVYTDPEGYYIVWERCCRNSIINNIQEPEKSGQAFYLEFPPVLKNNEPFENSSPILFPALSDYAVVNQLYYVDFGGHDPDGDSLAYSLATPLRGNSSPEIPVPNASPAPYKEVVWENGFDTDNMIPGARALTVDIEGNITVIPEDTGLYVFSIKCEEYRDGKKIGEVVRDFQLLVVDIEVGNNPEIQARNPENTDFIKKDQVIHFDAEDVKCFQLWITDPDEYENITVKAIPVNFTAELGEIFSETSGITKNADDVLKIDVCLPNCAYKVNEPFYIDFVAMDDACSLPLMDTVRVAFTIEPEPNQEPVFTEPLQDAISAKVSPGGTFELLLSGRDDDEDVLALKVHPKDFKLEDYGMTFTEIYNDQGSVEAVFNFNPDCDIHDFSLLSNFILDFVLEDVSDCKATGKDIIRLDLSVDFPKENKPVVSSDLKKLHIISSPGETIQFNVFGNDEDVDLINLRGYGADFAFSTYNMQFENKTGNGSLTSLFSWNTSCENLKNKDDFNLKFVVDDRGSCKKSTYDTLSVRIQIIAPENMAPVVSIDDMQVPVLNVLPGKRLEVKVVGFDSDNDSILLRMQDHKYFENLGFEFNEVEGIGKVSSVFIWTPECLSLEDGLKVMNHEFNFIVSDKRCLNAKSDTITLKVNIEDIEYNLDEFKPYNVFTPNNDQVNDFFELENLPPDNCENQFVAINIFNRWGKMVYYNDERNFRWDGKGFSTGVYYYVLKFSNYDFKGTVSLLE